MFWAIVAATISGVIVYVGLRHRVKKLESLERDLRWILDTDTYPRLGALDGKSNKPPVRPPQPVQQIDRPSPRPPHPNNYL